VIASATAVFDYRYGLPAAPLLYLAGGCGALALLQNRTGPPRGDGALGVAAPAAATSEGSTPQGEVDARGSARLRAWRRKHWKPLVVTGALLVAAIGLAAAPVERDDLYVRYVLTQAERGILGYPVADAAPSAQWPGWVERRFEGGLIAQAPGGAPVVVAADAERAYLSLGGVERFGAPTGSTREFTDAQARATWFESGALVLFDDGRILTVEPPLLERWCRPGRACAIGVPLSPVVTRADGRLVQRFENGAIVTRADGSARVVRPR
jgi:hypothetical protein